jgi:halocyanin-like protein
MVERPLRSRGNTTMSQETPIDRRQFVRATAAVALGGALLPGCAGSASEGTTTTRGDAEQTETGGESMAFDGWFDDVENYAGLADRTGVSEVTVTVGAEANGGFFGFEPAAVKVSPGTTVVWKWSGEGGAHNVVAADGGFESEMVAEAGHTFEHAFEAAGTYAYYCLPHRSMGMKGAVVVE